MIVQVMTTRAPVLTVLSLTLIVMFGSHSQVCGQTGEPADTRRKLFHQEPDTPARLLRSADAAARLNRTHLARGYLQTLLDRGLSSEEMLDLRDDVGVQLFLSLKFNPDLAPLAGELLQQVNAASSSAQMSAEHVDRLVQQLGEGGEQSRRAATQLLTIDAPVVSAVLAVSPDSDAGRMGRALVRRNLRQFRPQLLTALTDADGEDQRWLLNLLRFTADRQLAPRLLRYEFAADSSEVREAAGAAIDTLWPGPDRPETSAAAVRWLTRQAVRGLADAADRFSDGSTRDVLSQAVTLAEDALHIASDNQRARIVLLACRSAVNAEAARTSGEDIRSEALQVALQTENSAAAAALLGTDPEQLRRSTQLPRPAVRLEAATRLLNLDRPVRGQTWARQIIQSVANGSVGHEAVVIDPRQDAARLAAQLLDDQGYEATATQTGQSGFEQAVHQLNCELILIHSNCLRWPLSQTVANLRADSRTAQTPIAVYGPWRDRSAVQALQDQYPGIAYLPGPLSEINFADELRRSGLPGPLLTEAARSDLIEQARAAVVQRR